MKSSKSCRRRNCRTRRNSLNFAANLNSDQSPRTRLRMSSGPYVKLMSGRINEINERSQQYFNRDVKGVSPTTVKVFNKYGCLLLEIQVKRCDCRTGMTGFIPQKSGQSIPSEVSERNDRRSIMNYTSSYTNDNHNHPLQKSLAGVSTEAPPQTANNPHNPSSTDTV